MQTKTTYIIPNLQWCTVVLKRRILFVCVAHKLNFFIFLFVESEIESLFTSNLLSVFLCYRKLQGLFVWVLKEGAPWSAGYRREGSTLGFLTNTHTHTFN